MSRVRKKILISIIVSGTFFTLVSRSNRPVQGVVQESGVSKKSRKLQKTSLSKSFDEVVQARDIIKKALNYLVNNAYFMTNTEAVSKDLRELAVQIYKTEAYLVFTLAGLDSSIFTNDLNANPFRNKDVYFDGIHQFDSKSLIAFTTFGSSKTQRDKLMFALRSSIHENIFSMINLINEHSQTFSIDDFKYGGHGYVDIDIDEVINLYKKLSVKGQDTIDKTYESWQVLFYRGLVFILKHVASSLAQSMKAKGDNDAYAELATISHATTCTLTQIQQSISKK